MIVLATGYEAITGAFERIDITGVGGLKLRDKWADGPITYLGVQIAGFPNLFMLSGPQSGSGSANFPRGIEEICDWTTALLEHARTRGATRIEARSDAEQQWFEHVKEQAERVLVSKTKSWLTGYSATHRPAEPRPFLYLGGMVRYRRKITEQAQAGYPGFCFSSDAGALEASPVGGRAVSGSRARRLSRVADQLDVGTDAPVLVGPAVLLRERDHLLQLISPARVGVGSKLNQKRRVDPGVSRHRDHGLQRPEVVCLEQLDGRRYLGRVDPQQQRAQCSYS